MASDEMQARCLRPHYRGLNDFESLQGADLGGFGILIHQLFRLYEEAYFGQLEGYLDARDWHGWEVVMGDVCGYPGVQGWWRSRSHWFNEEFAKLVNQQQETAKHPRMFRETDVDH